MKSHTTMPETPDPLPACPNPTPTVMAHEPRPTRGYERVGQWRDFDKIDKMTLLEKYLLWEDLRDLAYLLRHRPMALEVFRQTAMNEIDFSQSYEKFLACL